MLPTLWLTLWALPSAAAVTTAQVGSRLMPLPAQWQQSEQPALQVPAVLSYQLHGPADPAAPALAGIGLLQQFWPSQLRLKPAAGGQLQIRYQRQIAVPALGDDESYQFQIKADQNGQLQIDLQAQTSTGVLYGLMTLSQLLDCPAVNRTTISNTAAPVAGPSCYLPQVSVADQPRFRWRGLLLDSSRRFIPLADIRRTLDGMAAAKLNVLHWHLTDDQAWRLESLSYPKLQQLASQGQYYRQAEVKALVQYAAARGIRIVPELDVPGHAWAIGQAYPELLAWPDQPDGQPGLVQVLPAQSGFGIFPAVLDPSKPAVWQFLQQQINEWQQLFPDTYLHIGGDEVKPDHWLASGAVQAYMRQHQLADAPALQAHFNQRLARLLQQANRRMVGWDETLHPALPTDTVVQSWQGQDALGAAVRAGHPALLSAGFYLDMPQSAWYHWRNDPVAVTAPLPAVAADAKRWQWQFSLLRLNQKKLDGALRLYQLASPAQADAQPASTAGGLTPAYQASLAVHGRGAVALDVTVLPDRLVLSGDNYLGPVQLEIPLALLAAAPATAAAYQSDLLIGNHRYPLTLQAGSYQPLPQQQPLTGAQQQLLLGGEAALWTELVSADLLDARLWPRLFAVAERFWSPAGRFEPRQQDSTQRQFYQRLARLDDYAAQIGLQHRAQQQAAVSKLTTEPTLQQQFIQLSTYLQPLHYYGRHHVKTRAGRYHLAEPLHGIADTLLLEPPRLLALQQAFASTVACQLPAEFADMRTELHALIDGLARYQGVDAPALQQVLAQYRQLLDLLAKWPVASGNSGKRLTLQQTLRQQLHQMQQPGAEFIAALPQPLLQWLHRCERY
jgi:hexosaminidase